MTEKDEEAIERMIRRIDADIEKIAPKIDARKIARQLIERANAKKMFGIAVTNAVILNGSLVILAKEKSLKIVH